jgi:hypothetical protein
LIGLLAGNGVRRLVLDLGLDVLEEFVDKVHAGILRKVAKGFEPMITLTSVDLYLFAEFTYGQIEPVQQCIIVSFEKFKYFWCLAKVGTYVARVTR